MKITDAPSIEDYLLIGDLRTTALISNGGSIDWLCLPNFDSPSVFGKLLDPSGGCFKVEMPNYEINTKYQPNTAIVTTTMSNRTSSVQLKDFMVPKSSRQNVKQQLVRELVGVRGQTQMVFTYQPAPNYARVKPDYDKQKISLTTTLESGSLVLHVPRGTTLSKLEDGYEISMQISAGQKKRLVLEFVPTMHQPAPVSSGLLQSTEIFWKHWVSQGTFFEPDRALLVRSAITLKLLQFAPTGAIVAAPTTSLPEQIGGVRNWDYRFVWIRDATFALYAFTVLGYKHESERFFDFIESITANYEKSDFDLSLMYTIWGKPVDKEQELDHLNGYRNSRPVRIGNGAANQFQLDVYGVLLDSIYLAIKQGINPRKRRVQSNLVMNLVRKIEHSWLEPDSGIWEARVGPKQYTYSRVMAWVGAERATKLCHELSLSDKDIKLCERLEKQIHKWIWDNCYSADLKIFEQYPGSTTTDATNLLFVLVKFLDKHDPLTKIIIDNTVKRLATDTCYVKRYHPVDDGLPGSEGAFMLCSYWLVSAWAILEDVQQAQAILKKLTSTIRSHGLIPEEIDATNETYLGNYPQAFSHMGYIMSAHYIHKYSKRLKSEHP